MSSKTSALICILFILFSLIELLTNDVIESSTSKGSIYSHLHSIATIRYLFGSGNISADIVIRYKTIICTVNKNTATQIARNNIAFYSILNIIHYDAKAGIWQRFSTRNINANIITLYNVIATGGQIILSKPDPYSAAGYKSVAIAGNKIACAGYRSPNNVISRKRIEVNTGVAISKRNSTGNIRANIISLNLATSISQIAKCSSRGGPIYW